MFQLALLSLGTLLFSIWVTVQLKRFLMITGSLGLFSLFLLVYTCNVALLLIAYIFCANSISLIPNFAVDIYILSFELWILLVFMFVFNLLLLLKGKIGIE